MRTIKRTAVAAEEEVSTVPPIVTYDARVKTYDGRLFTATKRHEIVIGIDQSLTNFAVVALSTEDHSYFGWLLQPNAKGVRRLLDIQSFLHRTVTVANLRSTGVVHVCMEGYSYGSIQSRREALGECGGITKATLLRSLGYSNQVSYPTVIAPGALKKFMTGQGDVKKNLILQQVMKKWNVEFDNDNVADAYGLARLAASLHTGDTSFAYEKEIVAKTETHTEWPKETVSSPSKRTRKRPS